MLKAHYCVWENNWGGSLPPILDLSALNHESSMFKGEMRANIIDEYNLHNLEFAHEVVAYSCNAQSFEEKLSQMIQGGKIVGGPGAWICWRWEDLLKHVLLKV